MSVFTTRVRNRSCRFQSDGSKGDLSRRNSISVKIDSKGRISIPSFLRKNLDVKAGDSLELVFDLNKNYFSINVQNGVVGSTSDCESLSLSSNLSSGLIKSKRRKV